MRHPRWYQVLTPEYLTHEDTYTAIKDRDSCAVFTRTARRAKVLAVRLWRRQRTDWAICSDNPFVGLEAKPIDVEAMRADAREAEREWLEFLNESGTAHA